MSEYPDWKARLSTSERLYRTWETKFKCKQIEEYMEGFQWREKRDPVATNYRPYTLNLFLTTRQIKLANWIFQRPSFMISPAEQNANEDFEGAVFSAQMKQDVLNAVIHNPNMNFAKIIKLSAQDSFSRFSIVEVGYATDWRNPQKLPDLVEGDMEDGNDLPAKKKFKIVKKNKLDKEEYAYIKRIKPERFRVSTTDAEFLEDHDWVGYYDYYKVSELKNAPNINWPKEAPEVGQYTNLETQSAVITSSLNSILNEEVRRAQQGLAKVWHIWDNVSRTRLLLLDAYLKEPLFEEEFEVLPLVDNRWIMRSDGFLPVPLAFNWISEQDEVNEAREQQRSYRRRFTRKFQSKKGAVSPDEVEKFMAGPDGICIEVTEIDAIQPIQNPEFGPTTTNELTIAKDDFNLVSGTSVDARDQSADRETATQAQLLDKRAQIRESSEQLDFSDFVSAIGRIMLYVIQENMGKSMWVKYTTNPTEQQPLSEVQINAPIYREITKDKLDDGYDFEIELDVINATPAAMQQQKQAFVEFLTLVQQFPAIAMSAILIREAAYRCGYRNEVVIHQMQQTAVLSMAAKASQAAAQQGKTLSQVMPPSNATTAKMEQMQPPTQPALQSQMEQQVNNPVQ